MDLQAPQSIDEDENLRREKRGRMGTSISGLLDAELAPIEGVCSPLSARIYA